MWTNILQKIVRIYNERKHADLGCSPSEYLLQRKHVLPTGVIAAAQYRKLPGPRFTPFVQGDMVLKGVQMKGNLVTNKLLTRYEGPYKILKSNENKVSYQIYVNGRVIKVHYDQLKPWYDAPKYLLSQERFRDLFEFISSRDDVEVQECISDGTVDSVCSPLDSITETDVSHSDSDSIVQMKHKVPFGNKLASTPSVIKGSLYQNGTKSCKHIFRDGKDKIEISQDGTARNKASAHDGMDEYDKSGDDMNFWSVSLLSNRISTDGRPVEGDNSNVVENIMHENTLESLERFIDNAIGEVTNNVNQRDLDDVKYTRNSLLAIKQTIAAQRNNIISPVNCRVTRSMGTVPDYPYVQESILERRARI